MMKCIAAIFLFSWCACGASGLKLRGEHGSHAFSIPDEQDSKYGADFDAPYAKGTDLVTEGKYKGMGQCPATVLDEMEQECRKNISNGATCHRTQFIQANSKHWLHNRLAHENPLPNKSQQHWQINTAYDLDGAAVSMLSPHGIYLVKGFLTEDEADQLRATFDNEHDGDIHSVGCPILRHHCHDPKFLTYPGGHCELRHANSSSFSFDSPGVPGVTDKIETLTRVPRRQYESFQMSKYLPGDFFSAHYDDDACDNQVPEMPEGCRKETRRIVTVLAYLTEHADGSGGATYFPDLDLRVQGSKGDAIVFFPIYLDGTLNPYLMHASEDSYKTKYVAQQWIQSGVDPSMKDFWNAMDLVKGK